MRIVGEILPRSTGLLAEWDPTSDKLPSEEVFAALVEDLKKGQKNRTITRVGRRLNYELPGMSGLFRSSGRKAGRMHEPPFKEVLIKANKRWGQIETWMLIKQFSPPHTDGYFLAALDAKRKGDGEIVRVGEEARIYLAPLRQDSALEPHHHGDDTAARLPDRLLVGDPADQDIEPVADFRAAAVSGPRFLCARPPGSRSCNSRASSMNSWSRSAWSTPTAAWR